jgi:hypothetical protein
MPFLSESGFIELKDLQDNERFTRDIRIEIL